MASTTRLSDSQISGGPGPIGLRERCGRGSLPVNVAELLESGLASSIGGALRH